MNIGIYANYLIFEKAGVGKYTENLIKNLLKIDRKNHYFLYFSFFRHRSQREKMIKAILPAKRKNITVRIFPLPARWYEFITSLPIPSDKIIRDSLDIFFSPYPAGIPKKGFPHLRQGSGGQAKMVATVHDLVFLRFPEHRGKKLSRYYFKRHKIAVQNAKKIIVPSRATKKDLIDFLGVSEEKISIVPEAGSVFFKKEQKKGEAAKAISKYFDPKFKYILSVGTLEPRKNLVKLVEAYSLLPYTVQEEYRLVLVGGKGWNNSALSRTINNLNLKDKVIFTGFVSDEDLPYIYNKAKVFVYPSLYEGFGLPPLEAMNCGVPVITSNCSSLPEVVNGAAMLCNCQKEEEIAAAIKKIILKPNLAEKLIKRGKIQAKKFSWEKAAVQTLAVFEEVQREE